MRWYLFVLLLGLIPLVSAYSYWDRPFDVVTYYTTNNITTTNNVTLLLNQNFSCANNDNYIWNISIVDNVFSAACASDSTGGSADGNNFTVSLSTYDIGTMRYINATRNDGVTFGTNFSIVDTNDTVALIDLQNKQSADNATLKANIDLKYDASNPNGYISSYVETDSVAIPKIDQNSTAWTRNVTWLKTLIDANNESLLSLINTKIDDGNTNWDNSYGYHPINQMVNTTSPVLFKSINTTDGYYGGSVDSKLIINSTKDAFQFFGDGVSYPDFLCYNRTGAGLLCEFPNGLYVSGSTFYATNEIKARGGIADDGAGQELDLNDNTEITGYLNVSGNIRVGASSDIIFADDADATIDTVTNCLSLCSSTNVCLKIGTAC